MFHPRPLDYVILAGVLVLSGLSYLYLPAGNAATMCYIFLDGKPFERLSLGADSNRRQDTIATQSGAVILERAENGIRVVQSSCRSKTCIHRGFIRRPGEAIVCVPNRFMAIIKSKQQVFDAVSE